VFSLSKIGTTFADPPLIWLSPDRKRSEHPFQGFPLDEIGLPLARLPTFLGFLAF
jgi:hypothetical protein